ncbi:hypothetical protein GCM10011372_29130 [Agromyces bauzanensis]|uniref:ACT domain-containing protein n=1 Tax=Agromyces bauzanensis TaxID=1308924 RepID=A0A917UVQ4_9MICO|nr:hypothetical protein GCM10011372_29130 [Agromyces bauzanensis]
MEQTPPPPAQAAQVEVEQTSDPGLILVNARPSAASASPRGIRTSQLPWRLRRSALRRHPRSPRCSTGAATPPDPDVETPGRFGAMARALADARINITLAYVASGAYGYSAERP